MGNLGTSTASQPSIGIALGKGDGTFTPSVTLTDASLDRPRSMVVADLNGDGNLDLVVASSSAPGPSMLGSLLVFFGQGNGTFNGLSVVQAAPSITVGVADFTQDGIPDLIGVSPDNGSQPGGYQIFAGTGISRRRPLQGECIGPEGLAHPGGEPE